MMHVYKKFRLHFSMSILLLAFLLSLSNECEGKKHDRHHHHHRSRRHHHNADFYETGSSHHSRSSHVDTQRTAHRSPHGHHHEEKAHHIHNDANKHQHFVTEKYSYETKHRSSYDYGSDYKDDNKPEIYYTNTEYNSQRGIKDDEFFDQDQTPMYDNNRHTRILVNPKLNEKQDTDYTGSSPDKVRVNPPIKLRKEDTNMVFVPTQTKQKNERVEIRNEKNIDNLQGDEKRTLDIMMNDDFFDENSPRSEGLTQRQEADGSSIGAVQANGLVKNHQPKSAVSATGRSRWTLTYQGGPSETALNNSVTNVTAQIGGAAFLPCRVGHLGDRQISWIRSRDWHVLTSGNDLFTPDPRFSVLHEAGTQDWTLHIKYATTRDNGTYECQVSTGTGIISLFVNLRVVTPEAHIPGRGQYHVNTGSPIVLTCVISKSPTPPQYVFWYHNGDILNFLRNRPDFTITLEPQTPLVELIDSIGGSLVSGSSGGSPASSGTGVASISRLQMKHAEDRHSGNYTCAAPKTRPASTLVFVTEGDKTAAVQRIDSGSPGSVSQPHQRNSAAVTLVATLIISSLLLPYYINSLSHSTAIRTVSCR